MKHIGSFLLISQLVLFQLLIISSPGEANVLKNIKGFLKDLFSGGNGEDNNSKPALRNKKLAWKSCLRKRTNLEDMNHATELCDEEFEDQNWEEKKKDILHSSLCFRACQLEHLGLIYETADGAGIEFNSTAVEQFVIHTFPEVVHSDLQEGLNDCGTKMDMARLSDEKQCKSYRPLLNCIDKAVNQNCRKSRKDKRKMLTSTTAASTGAFENADESSSVTTEPEMVEGEAEATETDQADAAGTEE